MSVFFNPSLCYHKVYYYALHFRYHDTIECYDEAKDCWEIIGEMPSSRSWLSCAAMTIRKDSLPPQPETRDKVTCIVWPSGWTLGPPAWDQGQSHLHCLTIRMDTCPPSLRPGTKSPALSDHQNGHLPPQPETRDKVTCIVWPSEWTRAPQPETRDKVTCIVWPSGGTRVPPAWDQGQSHLHCLTIRRDTCPPSLRPGTKSPALSDHQDGHLSPQPETRDKVTCIVWPSGGTRAPPAWDQGQSHLHCLTIRRDTCPPSLRPGTKSRALSDHQDGHVSPQPETRDKVTCIVWPSGWTRVPPAWDQGQSHLHCLTIRRDTCPPSLRPGTKSPALSDHQEGHVPPQPETRDKVTCIVWPSGWTRVPPAWDQGQSHLHCLTIRRDTCPPSLRPGTKSPALSDHQVGHLSPQPETRDKVTCIVWPSGWTLVPSAWDQGQSHLHCLTIRLDTCPLSLRPGTKSPALSDHQVGHLSPQPETRDKVTCIVWPSEWTLAPPAWDQGQSHLHCLTIRMDTCPPSLRPGTKSPALSDHQDGHVSPQPETRDKVTCIVWPSGWTRVPPAWDQGQSHLHRLLHEKSSECDEWAWIRWTVAVRNTTERGQLLCATQCRSYVDIH